MYILGEREAIQRSNKIRSAAQYELYSFRCPVPSERLEVMSVFEVRPEGIRQKIVTESVDMHGLNGRRVYWKII